jgi:hypothetical protein
MMRRALLQPAAVSRLIRCRGGLVSSHSNFLSTSQRVPLLRSLRPTTLRSLSTEKNNTQKTSSTNAAEDATTKEIVLTPGEKVVVAGRLGLWLAVGSFAAVCAYYIGKELLPT